MDLVVGNRKVEVKKVGDLGKVEEVDGRFLVHSASLRSETMLFKAGRRPHLKVCRY